ncbi:hypothetical protein H8E07_17505, partial [bacterium]|nr:hypothetical protein [bacterium]
VEGGVRACPLQFWGGGPAPPRDLTPRAATPPDADGTPPLPALGGRAEETRGRARRALADQQPLQALRFARRAREQAQRVLRQLGPAPDAEGVEAQLDHFEEQVARAADDIRGSGDRDAQRLLDRSLEMRDQARAALARGELEQALRAIRSALNLLRQSAERIR